MMPRARFLSVSPPPTAMKHHHLSNNGSAGGSAKRRAIGSSPAKNNRDYESEYNDSNAIKTIITVAVVDEEQSSLQHHCAGGASLTAAIPIMKQRRASSFPNAASHEAEYEEDISCIAYEQDQGGEEDGKKTEQEDDLQERGINEENEQDYLAPDNEPDWNAIAQHHPAKKDVPIFLEARDRRRKLDEHFIGRLNEWNATMHAEIDSIWNAMVEIYQARTDKLNELEDTIKNLFLNNDISRAEMERKLEASTREVHSLYSSLMMQICQPSAAIPLSLEGGINKSEGR